jgi:hypothetical protein
MSGKLHHHDPIQKRFLPPLAPQTFAPDQGPVLSKILLNSLTGTRQTIPLGAVTNPGWAMKSRIPVLLLSLLVACGPGSDPRDTASAADLQEPDLYRDTAPLDLWEDTPPLDLAADDIAPLDQLPDLPTVCQAGDPCDDQDPCTFDQCQDALCTHQPMPAGFCCDTKDDCDDGIACTQDSCSKNRCLHVREDSTCCALDSDCNDYQPCTQDLCVANLCAHVFSFADSCHCNGNLDCDDGLACTRQECAEGACLYSLASAPGPQCCTTDGDCDDEDPATQDQCLAFTCQHHLPAPCLADLHCDDGNPCTLDTCEESLCLHQPLPAPQCCVVDGQCLDLSDLTWDSCVGNRCLNSPKALPLSCKDDSKCPADSPCADHSCVSGFCSVRLLEGETCCSAHAQCQSADPCLDPVCQDFTCTTLPHEGPAPVQTWDFDDGTMQGFTATVGDDKASWQPSQWYTLSPAWSLHMGNPQDKQKMLGGSTLKAVVVSPSFTAPEGATVSLWLFVDLEPISSRDLFVAELNCGSGYRKLFNKDSLGGSTAGQWVQRSSDLAPHEYGRPCTLRYSFDSVDSTNNNYKGVFLDDISVNRACAPVNE